MTEAQIQLQNALTTTFLSNLAFLSEYDNELYQRVDELSRMIERGEYKEKYALEFNMQDGEFDIYDIVNDKYLYNKTPKKINNELLRKSEENERNYILDIAEYFSPKLKDNPIINREKRFELSSLVQLGRLTVEDARKYIDVTGDFVDNRKNRLKEVKKFIFIGTLLGRHIPKIARNVDANIYLVLEKNLEIFRLSLFTVDYTILAKRSLIFSIMDSVSETEAKIAQFMRINYLDNYLIKFSTTSINIEEYVDTILNTIKTFSPASYDYNRRLYTHLNRTTKYIKESYKIILFDKIKNDSNFFNELPILYLAAGPSLDENIKWIQENQNRFFIVTIGASYKKLIENSIRVDLIISLDEQYGVLNNRQFDDKSVSKISEDTMILASTITHENILKKFNQDNLYLYEIFTTLHKDNIIFDGFSVGEIGLNILFLLNAKEIYLVGLDLSLNQETGDTHSKDSNSGIRKIELNKQQNRDIFDLRESLIKVKGNHKDIVYTTPLFFSSIKSIEEKVKYKNQDVRIYNISTSGAHFEGVIPKRVEDINVQFLNKQNINIKDFFKLIEDNSLKNISDETKSKLKIEIDFIENQIIKSINNIEAKEYKIFDELFKDIINISDELLDNNHKLAFQILINYYQIYLPYLLYYFNDKKFKEEKKKVKQIQKVFIKQISNLIDDYILCLKRII